MGNINSFFQKKPKAGRPAKSSNAGRKPAPSPEEPSAGLQPPTAAAMAAAAKAKSVAENLASAATRAISGQVLDAAETAAVARAAAAAAKVPMGKRSRANWSAPGNVERLSKAVNGWPAYKKANPTRSIEGYANDHKIAPKTLAKYINGTYTVGKGQGRPGLLKADEEKFVVDVVQRHDRGRDGLTPVGVVSLIASVKPGLKHKQAENLAQKFRKRNSDKLTDTTTAQATTTRRTNINVAQQYRFFQVGGIA